MRQGLIHLYTGDGKGKTTAAIGLSVRARGAGYRVLFAQFMKGRDTAELAPLRQLGIEIHRTSELTKFLPAMSEEERRSYSDSQRCSLQYARENAERFDLIVLDEIVSAITTSMVEMEDVVSFLAQKPKALEVVLTGRDAPDAIRSMADYVSTVTADKHPYTAGIMARKGIEY
ncbi:MAG: cob(I)yrinic acid a,c-diamide adenosyltransferase [Planctomycetaceae bacterium]|nr:cob(I)yrinic acid a,c-diamide adenosyltransferase [Planctomycetaceae bacterium]